MLCHKGPFVRHLTDLAAHLAAPFAQLLESALIGNIVRQDLIGQSTFLVDAPGPAPGEFVLEWLRLSQAGKWVPLHLAY